MRLLRRRRRWGSRTLLDDMDWEGWRSVWWDFARLFPIRGLIEDSVGLQVYGKTQRRIPIQTPTACKPTKRATIRWQVLLEEQSSLIRAAPAVCPSAESRNASRSQNLQERWLVTRPCILQIDSVACINYFLKRRRVVVSERGI